MKNSFLILFVLFFSILAKGQETAEFSGEEAAVNQVIFDLFDAMREGDSTKLRKCFHPQVTMWTSYTNKNGEKVLKSDDVEGFITAVGTPHDDIWDEKLRNTKVLIDGNLAQAWTEYGFFLGEKFSHCGIDAFLMTLTEEGWKILNLADTRRRSNCDWE